MRRQRLKRGGGAVLRDGYDAPCIRCGRPQRRCTVAPVEVSTGEMYGPNAGAHALGVWFVMIRFSKGEIAFLARVIGGDRRDWSTHKRQRPRCGARCRDGHACRARAVWDKVNDRPRNGRCRMHGGLSTGPRTVEGRRRALRNLKQFRGRGEATDSAEAPA